jgi:hypothetical protein
MKNRSYIGIVAVAAKSWTFATVLITRAAERPLRILCTHETMAWIRESVHQLLSDRIYALGLADQFAIGKTSAVPSQPNPACRPEPVTPGWLHASRVTCIIGCGMTTSLTFGQWKHKQERAGHQGTRTPTHRNVRDGS